MKRSFYLLGVLLLLAGCQNENPNQGINEPDEQNAKVNFIDGEYEQGWVRVKLKRSAAESIDLAATRSGEVVTGIEELDRLAASFGASRIERTFMDGGKFQARREKYGLHLWYDLYVGEDLPLTRAMTDLSALSQIEYIENIPVYRQSIEEMGAQYDQLAEMTDGVRSATRASASYPFNDPHLYRQHHYKNFGDRDVSFRAGADANVFAAWEITAGHPDVIVAVIDGGVDYDHPDLAANMWVNTAEKNGRSGRDDDGNGYVDDIHGICTAISGDATGNIIPLDHGTHCAGTIAAVNNNGIGVAGVAGGTGNGDGVRIMSCQTMIPDPQYAVGSEEYYSEVKSTNKANEAWLYAADNGAVIASCSFGKYSTYSQAHVDAMNYFIETAGVGLNGEQTGPIRGGLVICSAGNDGLDKIRYPGGYPQCVSTAWMSPDYTKHSKSNYGTWVDITAPGGNTSSSFSSGKKGGVYSTIVWESPNSTVTGYGNKQGTSMATPHVAGVAALVISKHGVGRQGLTAEQVKTRLLNTVRVADLYNYNAAYLGKMGAGLVDAYAAVADLTPPAKPSTSTTWNSDNIRVRVTIGADMDGDAVSKYEFFWLNSAMSNFNPDATGAGVSSAVFTPTATTVGTNDYFTVRGLNPGTKYYVTVYAVDKYGTRSEKKYYSGTTAN